MGVVFGVLTLRSRSRRVALGPQNAIERRFRQAACQSRAPGPFGRYVGQCRHRQAALEKRNGSGRHWDEREEEKSPSHWNLWRTRRDSLAALRVQRAARVQAQYAGEIEYTPDFCLRRAALYPAELRVLVDFTLVFPG